MLSETVRADAREGDIGMQLGEIAKVNPEVAIGSYPFFHPQHGPNTNVVLRARDAQKLAQGSPWTLAFGHHEDRTPTHGYEPTREAAMAAFAKSWRRE